MEREQILERLHKLAAEMSTFDTAGQAPAGDTNAANVDNLLRRYGFSSIDAIEYLLAVEEEFDIEFKDEDLSEEMLSSTSHLANRVSLQVDAESTS